MPPETHTKLRNVRVAEPLWSAFMAACAEEGTTASEQVRRMIEVWLEGR